jgi:hypothetical protein
MGMGMILKYNTERTNDDPKGTHPYHWMRRFAQSIMEHIRTTECKRELKEGHSSAPTGAKTAIHDSYV